MSFTNEIWLAIRTDTPDPDDPDIGTPKNPYRANTAEEFATVMRDKAPANRIIRLGPGIFRTRGRGGNGYIMANDKLWLPSSGQRIIGSGMFATTLLFDFDLFSSSNPPLIGQNIHPGQRHFMVDSNTRQTGRYLSSFEISDLTIDCNLQNTPFDPTLPISSGTIVGTVPQAGTTVTTQADYDWCLRPAA